MAEAVITLQPGEERLIRVRCGAPPAPGAGENGVMAPAPGEDVNGMVAPEPFINPEPVPQEPAQNIPAGAEAQVAPAGAQNIVPQPGPPPNQRGPNNIPPNIPEYPMAQRKSRKSRKNRKQSGGKRGMNPFMKFAAKERKNIMSSNPGMPIPEIGKELGKRWRALSESERSKY